MNNEVVYIVFLDNGKEEEYEDYCEWIVGVCSSVTIAWKLGEKKLEEHISKNPPSDSFTPDFFILEKVIDEDVEEHGVKTAYPVDSVRFMNHLDRIAGLLGIDWTDGDFPIEECISLMKRESLL